MLQFPLFFRFFAFLLTLQTPLIIYNNKRTSKTLCTPFFSEFDKNIRLLLYRTLLAKQQLIKYIGREFLISCLLVLDRRRAKTYHVCM